MTLLPGQHVAGDRIIQLVTLVFAGAALSAVSALPSRRVEIDVLGSPLGFDLSGQLLVGALLVVLCVIGVDRLVRGAPDLGAVPHRYTATFWILPALVTFAAVTTVPRLIDEPLAWVSVLLLLALLLSAVLAAEYGTAAGEGNTYRFARVMLNVAIYGAAFALYASIYGAQLRGLVSGPMVMVVTFPLAIELLRGTEEQLATTVIHAAIVAIVLGELIVPLNWLGLPALAGGGALLVFFYALGGMSQQHLAGRLSRRVAAEFAWVATVGLVAIALSLR